MFMLRCGFWLSVMFASLPLGTGVISALPTGKVVTAASVAVAGQVGDWCAARQSQCARDAARLTALVAAKATGPDAEIAGGDDAALAKSVAPARHHAAKTMLTAGR